MSERIDDSLAHCRLDLFHADVEELGPGLRLQTQHALLGPSHIRVSKRLYGVLNIIALKKTRRFNGIILQLRFLYNYHYKVSNNRHRLII